MAIIGVSGYAGSGKDTVGKLIQIASCNNIPEGLGIEDLVYNTDNLWWVEEGSGWEVKKWAGKLKTIASMITGIPVENFEDQEFKKTYLGPEWDQWSVVFQDGSRYGNFTTKEEAESFEKHERHSLQWSTDFKTSVESFKMTVRDFLQKLGTDGLRDGLHTNTWVNALMADYKKGPFYPEVPAEDHAKLPNWIITDTRFPNEAQAIKDKGGIVIRIDRPGYKPVNAHPSETGLDDWNFDHKIMNGSDLTSLLFTVGGILRKENLI